MTVERWTDEMLDKLADSISNIGDEIKDNTNAIKQLREESKEQGIRFAAYQQSSQWVVNLAFALIASATVTTLASAIFRR
jgi:lipopolysaccharide export LptBFGC system permease protein LptF